MDDYTLGPQNDRGEFAVINPNVPPTHPDRIVGYARLHLLDTAITGINVGEEYELGGVHVTWTRDDTSRYDG
jgi:hypothetical protein